MTRKILFVFSLISVILLSSCHNYSDISSSNSNNNTFYIGVENPLVLIGKNAQKAEVKVSCGEICLVHSARDTAIYYISPCRERTTLVTATTRNKTTQYLYRNKQIPNPILVPAVIPFAERTESALNSFSSFFSAQEFQNFMGIRCVMIDFDYPCVATVLDYDITRIRMDETDENWRIDRQSNLSSRFPRAITYNAEKGDIYRISNCRIELSSPTYTLPVSSEIRALQDYLIVIE
jgi:hypothetical protein